MVEFTAMEQNKEKRMKRNEDSLRDLWDNSKRNNIRIIGVPEGEERDIKVMKVNQLQPRLLYLARITFRFNGEIKTFTDKQKLTEFSTTKPALQQMLKELL